MVGRKTKIVDTKIPTQRNKTRREKILRMFWKAAKILPNHGCGHILFAAKSKCGKHTKMYLYFNVF